MITDKGKELLALYLTGNSASWAGALEFGVGQTAATSADVSLEFPFVRVPIQHIDYFYDTTALKWKVRFRGVLETGDAGQFYEVGVFSSEEFPEQEAGNLLLLDYSGLDTVYASDNATTISGGRVGSLATLVSVPSGQSGFVRGFKPGVDLSVYSGNDTINLAYDFTQISGVPTIKIRFESTDVDYYEYTFSPSTGYNIEVAARSSFIATGAPDWNSANTIYVEVSSEGDVILDGLIMEDNINIPSYGMVIREVLLDPIVKTETGETEVSFDLELDF